MTIYAGESFYRATIRQSIANNTLPPFALKVSKVPTLTTGLLTISPNTANEEVIEYSAIDATALTITVSKRGINKSSQTLTTNGAGAASGDYNNSTYMMNHSQNDSIRGDLNHLHIAQIDSYFALAENETTTGNNTHTGIETFTKALRIPSYVDTTARGVGIPSPVAGDMCEVAGDIYKYNDVTVQWEILSVGTPTPNASTTVAGKVEMATSGEITAGTATGGTGALLAVGPDTLKTKTDAMATASATALANDYRTVTTATTSAVTSGAITYSSVTTFPRHGSVLMYITSVSGSNAGGGGVVQMSPVGAGTWTDSPITVGVANGTSATSVIPIPGNIDVRIKCIAPSGAGTETASVFSTYYL